MLCQTIAKIWVKVVLGVNAKSYIVSGSPSNPMLGGGELGVIVVLGVNAASQQTLLLSPAPHPIQC